MKKLLFLFFMIPVALVAQDFELIEDNGEYRLRSFTIVDGEDGGVDTLYQSYDIGNQTQATVELLRLWRGNRRQHYQAMATTWEKNRNAANNSLEAMLLTVGLEIDSVYTARNWQNVFPDTAVITVPSAIIPVEELADYTNDTLAPPVDIDITVYPFLQANGNVQLRAVDTPGRWRVVLNGRFGLELRNFAGAQTEFFVTTVSDRRVVYRSEDGLARRSDGTRIVVTIDNNPINFDEGNE